MNGTTIDPLEVNVAHELKALGYYTGFIGKVKDPSGSLRDPTNQRRCWLPSPEMVTGREKGADCGGSSSSRWQAQGTAVLSMPPCVPGAPIPRAKDPSPALSHRARLPPSVALLLRDRDDALAHSGPRDPVRMDARPGEADKFS